MIIIFICILGLVVACSGKHKSEKIEALEDLIAVMDTIWKTEQGPITLRDSFMTIYGSESIEFKMVKNKK